MWDAVWGCIPSITHPLEILSITIYDHRSTLFVQLCISFSPTRRLFCFICILLASLITHFRSRPILARFDNFSNPHWKRNKTRKIILTLPQVIQRRIRNFPSFHWIQCENIEKMVFVPCGLRNVKQPPTLMPFWAALDGADYQTWLRHHHRAEKKSSFSPFSSSSPQNIAEKIMRLQFLRQKYINGSKWV